MAQRKARVKSIINANVNANVVEQINALFEKAPRTVSKSVLIELILKKGLQHKQEIEEEMQTL